MNIHRVVAPYTFSSLRKLLEIDKQTKIDIIHTHATSGLSYTLLQKLTRRKLINGIHLTHVHGTTKGILQAWTRIPSDIHSRRSFKRRIKGAISILRETVTWKNADALITNSRFIKKELTNIYGVPKEKIHVVYNGVDMHTFYPRNSRTAILRKHGFDPKSHIILYLGGFRTVKGALPILKAMERIHIERKDVKLIFVGGKHPLDILYHEALAKLMRKLVENGSIRTVENIPHIKLPDYYSAVDAVVVPSIYDAFPKVMLEAMACGTPVIASNVGGIPELISHYKTGVLVEPADPHKLAEAIITTVSNSDLREKLGFESRKLVKERFAWEQVAKQVLAIYEKLISTNTSHK